ncbi:MULTISPECIES: hypothetical protein [unclassified Streptomyces]|uniref:hypothetical protein n=1 Tax=unclassified Streptomyces TaxID=2593676 RepID=UPI00226D6407|nr:MULTISPECIES: hypothetical protein [unclassified Streptomyces]MCY0923945.1 hypothetical protein [Streptomyces sp. H27-G5]MCY0962618.1 hypothetical protein [Streptomyces sp. H27-H5]
MAVGDTTPAERLERLRSLLAGTRRDSRASQVLAGGDKGNVLFGVALHAADRLQAGKVLTPLEGKVLAVLRAALPDEEIKEWGRTYRAAVSAQGRLAVVPEVITSRPVGSGYEMVDLEKDFGPVASEHVARANSAIVDREAVAAGAPVDSPAFRAGMRDAGFGVTVFSGGNSAPTAYGDTIGADAASPAGEQAPDPAGLSGGTQQTVEPLAPTPFRAALEFESFRVERAVGDQGGGRDEIYWCSSACSDLTVGRGFRSEEFGAVEQGDTRTFAADKRSMFNGDASTGMFLNICVWEADHSTSAWYDKLQTALNTLSKELFSTWQWAVTMAIASPGMLTGIAMEIGIIFVALIDQLRNEDDLSCQRLIVMDQYDLALLAHYGHTEWHFDGDGYHVLKAKYTGAKVPFPTGTLEYAVRSTGGVWGKPITLPWDSATPPALASFENKLHALYSRPSDNQVMWTRRGTAGWSIPVPVGTAKTLHAPALAVHRGRLYSVVTNPGPADIGLYSRSLTGNTWSAPTEVPKIGSKLAPGLGAQFADRLWLTHVHASNETPIMNTLYDKEWDPTSYPDTADWKIGSSVSMCPFNGLMFRATASKGSSIYLATSDGGPTWVDHPTTWYASHTPAMTTNTVNMWMFFRTTDGKLHEAMCSTPHNTWTNPAVIPNAAPMDAPAAASHDGKLYVMYRR